jgi:hypothetical protein
MRHNETYTDNVEMMSDAVGFDTVKADIGHFKK